MTYSPETIDDTYRIPKQIETLITSSDDEFDSSVDEFITNRVSELNAQTQPKPELSGFSGNYKGFIRPDTEVLPFAMGTGFYVNDDSIYRLALNKARHFRSVLDSTLGQDTERLYRNVALWSAQYTQQEYFGNIRPSNEGAAMRGSLVERGSLLDSQEEKPASIAELKNIAMCAERAAVANNILWFFGMKPVFVMGQLKISEERSELHAYLVYKIENGQNYIYDPTNPLRNHNGQNLVTVPATYPIDEDFLGTLNTSAEAVHNTQTINSDNEQDRNETYVFLNNPFHSEVFPG